MDEALKNDEVDGIESVSLLPVNAQNNAKKLMKYLCDQSNVTWKRGGEDSIERVPMRRMNIIDLIGDIVHRTKPYSNYSLEPFLKAMVKANISKTLVENKTALENYHAIKNDAIKTTSQPLKEVLAEDEKKKIRLLCGTLFCSKPIQIH